MGVVVGFSVLVVVGRLVLATMVTLGQVSRMSVCLLSMAFLRRVIKTSVPCPWWSISSGGKMKLGCVASWLDC